MGTRVRRMASRTKDAAAKNSHARRVDVLDKLEQKELGILHLIHSGVNSSRLELAGQTNLSPASITTIVQRLMTKDLVVESEPLRSQLGRRPVPLEIRGDAAYLVGVDIGSFYQRILITDINGKIVYKWQSQTAMWEGRKRVLERTFRAVHEAMRESRLSRGAIKGIGIAHSGVIDSEAGLVLCYPRPGQMAEWKNVPLKDLFQKEFKVPCLLEDSVRTTATAEKTFGLGKELSNFIYIDVGMGIGAGIFLDGKLYRGAGGSAGEFGHITVDENGPLCSCGNNGCLETVASCAAIIQNVRAAIEQGIDSKIRDLVGGDLKKVSIEIIAQAVKENDSLAFRVLQKAGSYIGIGLADLVNLLNPRVMIFGGALFRAVPQLLSDPLSRIIKQRSLEKSANDAQLLVSPLGGEACALGASRLMAERILNDLYAGAQPHVVSH
ncbi:MAG TPA: ROK family protein [Acidobacteriaceae bacterium]|nr:ROK family protein [Acidobacteriaceae bacterium]